MHLDYLETSIPWHATDYDNRVMIDDAAGIHLATIHKAHHGNALDAHDIARETIAAVNAHADHMALAQATRSLMDNIEFHPQSDFALIEAVHTALDALESTDGA